MNGSGRTREPAERRIDEVRHGAALAAINVFLFSVPARSRSRDPIRTCSRRRISRLAADRRGARDLRKTLTATSRRISISGSSSCSTSGPRLQGDESHCHEKAGDGPRDVSTLNYLSKAYRGMGDASKARRFCMGSSATSGWTPTVVRNAGTSLPFRRSRWSRGCVCDRAQKKRARRIVCLRNGASLHARMLYAQALAEYLKVIETYPRRTPSPSRCGERSRKGRFRQGNSPRRLNRISGSIRGASLRAVFLPLSGPARGYKGAVRAVLDPAIASGNTKECGRSRRT